MMITETKLLELIANGENSSVEFKRDDVDNRSIAKELVAFANLQGGRLLLGVEDDGTISGLERSSSELEEFVMTAARDKIRPALIPHFQVLRNVEDDRHVAILTIDEGWTVHAVWHNQKEHYYIRVGTQTRSPHREELERLFQQRGNLRGELRPVSGSALEDLDRRRLLDYFRRVRRQAVPDKEDDVGWEQLLDNTEFMTSETDSPTCTIAGVLLFGESPRHYLPQSGIAAAAYQGDQKDYETRDRAQLTGPMVGLFSNENDGVKLVESGLVEQAMDFVHRNVETTSEIEEGGRRIDQKAYPLEAVREAIVNALVHRDYLLAATDIELAIYDDRMEIISPGRLPNTITPERMRNGCRAARNQLLKDTMRDYDYLEHVGLGVPKKIIKLMNERNGTEPDLVEENDRFLVRLWK